MLSVWQRRKAEKGKATLTIPDTVTLQTTMYPGPACMKILLCEQRSGCIVTNAPCLM
jgi:hypothetical protein